MIRFCQWSIIFRVHFQWKPFTEFLILILWQIENVRTSISNAIFLHSLAQVGLKKIFSQNIGLFFLWINSKFLPKIAFSKIGIYHDMSKYVPLRPFMWFVRDSFGNIWSIWIGFDVTYSEIDRPAWFTFLRMAYWSQKPICLDSVSVLLNIIRILFHICYGMHFYYIYTYEYIPDEN